MRSRLHYAGMRPINNVVDITNYVMLECGQPLHAFDYDVLVKRAGGKRADDHRPARERRREAQDARRPGPRRCRRRTWSSPTPPGAIALAGVMGGLETEVTATTKTILLESASFDFVSVRKTARQFNLFSEASTRFSRGVHPELALPAAQRAAGSSGGTRRRRGAAGIVDNYPAPLPPQVIDLERARSAGCSASTSRRRRSSAC